MNVRHGDSDCCESDEGGEIASLTRIQEAAEHRKAGRLSQAEEICRQVLQDRPHHPDALHLLGVIALQWGNVDSAIDLIGRAISADPLRENFHLSQGNALIAKGLSDEAIISYRQAILINPDYAEAYCNIGAVNQSQGLLDDAIASYRQAILTKPDCLEAYCNLGDTLREQGKLDEAVIHYRQALSVKPDHSYAYTNLIFTMDLGVESEASALLTERQRWAAVCADPLLGSPEFPHLAEPERRLRIGYVSADFKRHSAAIGFGAMLTHFDPASFEVFAYSNSLAEDGHTQSFRQHVTCWRTIFGLSDDVVADLIRQDGIDILVDLSGHSAGNRLLVFARKPVPIQITAWGYAGGTGMKAMDVLFSDPVVVPPEEKRYYVEEIRYLPSVISAYFSETFPEVNALPAMSSIKEKRQTSGLLRLTGNALANVFKGRLQASRSHPASMSGTGAVTFGSLNRLVKISSASIKVWSAILLAIPSSRMVLKVQELEDVGTKDRIIGQFIQHGVDPERISLLGNTSWQDHVATFNRIDISLDPFPQSGGVTTLEALMMGVPVVTLRGNTFAGRGSASILTTLGLTDWIAETPEQYVEITIQKAQNLAALAELRQQLRPRFMASIIGDTQAYARAVEQEYRKLWWEWCDPCDQSGGRAEVQR